MCDMVEYSLLQTVVEACQKKRHCKFIASQKALQTDPCPAVRKFVEVSYKCRPYEFRSKVACENDMIQLMCNPYSRIAIYGASYGKTEYESLQCAQPAHVPKDEICPASYTTETVMKICHGQRKCSLTADSATFGKPCKPEVRMYLKVVYTCVPKKVLKDRFDTPPEADEPQQNDIDHDHDELYDDDQFYKEPEAIPPEPKLQGDLAKDRSVSDTIPSINSIQPSSVRPPMRNRDDSSLEARRGHTKKEQKRAVRSNQEQKRALWSTWCTSEQFGALGALWSIWSTSEKFGAIWSTLELSFLFNYNGYNQ
ncbi:hypothetical protein PVAND_009474 [Polypedilum vanderplanki]|uniref:SUEL-type lectin domain-containing protein n=1 Tax=Polypedilum vanderplanki TaxID=319348 RepID=A0A9J6CDU6_POLVA|nr:hypothetical protein PVAND_009474 [Polypedilum vanderplanki]